MNEVIIKQELRRLRQSLNMTQKEFAEKIGVSQANVSQWESGSAMPSLRTYAKLQQYFPVFFSKKANQVKGERSSGEDRYVDLNTEEFNSGDTVDYRTQIEHMKERILQLEQQNRELKEDKEFLKSIINKEEGS